MTQTGGTLRRRATALALALLALPAAAAGTPADAPAIRPFHPEGAIARPPAGVRDARVLQQGEVALGFQYARHQLDGNRDDTDNLRTAEVRARGFGSAATRMDRDEYWLTALWAPLERLTLSLEIPWVATALQQELASGAHFTTRSEGLGDLRLTGVVPFMEHRDQSILLALGLSVPTGDIALERPTPLGRARLPYRQRHGSGSVDLEPNLAYRGFTRYFSWGGQLGGAYRLHRNHLDYRLGHRFEVSAWGAVQPISWLSASVRIAYADWGRISGEDEGLPLFTQEHDPNLQGGRQLDVAPGLNLALPVLGAQRFAVEAAFPVFRDLSGPQLEQDFRLVAGWQWEF